MNSAEARAASAGLPPSVRVIVRDWLSANQVVLSSREGNVVVDTGYGTRADQTLALLASPAGIGDEPLALVVNTHTHSDHVGGNAAIRRRYGCRIAIPEGEARAIDEWDEKALLLSYAAQRCERFGYDFLLASGSRYRWGELDWVAHAAPGHDHGALVFHQPEHGILVSGDALWEHGFGFVMPREVDPTAIPLARATLDAIAALDVRVVIPGHGRPFTGVGAALERGYRRLDALDADPIRVARQAIKVVFVFSLLDWGRFPRARLPGLLERTGIYRDLNDRFFRHPASVLAETMVDELLAAGAIEVDGDDLVPAGRGMAAG